jgi:hypothetical protein
MASMVPFDQFLYLYFLSQVQGTNIDSCIEMGKVNVFPIFPGPFMFQVFRKNLSSRKVMDGDLYLFFMVCLVLYMYLPGCRIGIHQNLAGLLIPLVSRILNAGRDVMIDSPSEISETQKKELGLF